MTFRLPITRPRREDGTLLPALLLAALVAGLAAQLLFVQPPALPGAGAVPVSLPAEVAARAGDAPAPVILERPLFAPSRRADGGGLASGGAGASAPMGGAVVAGMVARGRAARAFLRLPDGQVVALPIGGSYAGWRLTSLSNGSARFIRDGEIVTVPFGAAALPPAAGSQEDEVEEDEE